MHYDNTLNGAFPNPIMVHKTTGASIGVNKEMSPIDIRKLNTMYPCKSSTINAACGKLYLVVIKKAGVKITSSTVEQNFNSCLTQ